MTFHYPTPFFFFLYVPLFLNFLLQMSYIGHRRESSWSLAWTPWRPVGPYGRLLFLFLLIIYFFSLLVYLNIFIVIFLLHKCFNQLLTRTREFLAKNFRHLNGLIFQFPELSRHLEFDGDMHLTCKIF